MQPLDELLEECGNLHGHMCAGQLLGARMAMLGCRLIDIADPRGADRKKLIVWVEIDRCMADAVGAVTGVRLGKRSLLYLRDFTPDDGFDSLTQREISRAAALTAAA